MTAIYHVTRVKDIKEENEDYNYSSEQQAIEHATAMINDNQLKFNGEARNRSYRVTKVMCWVKPKPIQTEVVIERPIT